MCFNILYYVFIILDGDLKTSEKSQTKPTRIKANKRTGIRPKSGPKRLNDQTAREPDDQNNERPIK